MKSKIKLAVLGFLASFSLVAGLPVSASAHSYRHMKKDPNIVQKAVAINKESGEFSTLIAAVSCTNLVNRLQKDYQDFTLFAPTDAAFAKLGLNAGNICTSFDKHTLAGILKYHVTWGKKDAAEVLSRKKLWMLNGEKAIISGATIDGQNIVMTDVKTSNGIIHVIDGVMLP